MKTYTIAYARSFLSSNWIEVSFTASIETWYNEALCRMRTLRKQGYVVLLKDDVDEE